MPNRLAGETSPYLLQHANNPVDWQPWGEEAFAKARAEDKPLFLSIGYAACHWCHVMEHESFENAEMAGLMNEHFVCIKVDREERPDLDQIYMNAVQLMTGRGGWPMSVFLTHDGRPFYGGTYWPPQARMGMPGFGQVLLAVHDAWQNRRDAVNEQAADLTAHLRGIADVQAAGPALGFDLLLRAGGGLLNAIDSRWGGFGDAPKFPHPMALQVLLRLWRRGPRAGWLDPVTLTLDRMAAGGIYDQLGGGFHRYSVDERWLVPHFEKMLYDNALLASCYLEAWQVTGKPRYAEIVRETLDYVLREMTGREGGFFSTQDADSEGVEGKFYVWKPAELDAILGPKQAETFAYVYDVTVEGNFEGHNILNLPRPLAECAGVLGRDVEDLKHELAASRAKLLAVRNRRVWPGLDDKIQVNWNGLMIDALARAGAVLGEERYTAAAAKAADFILTKLRDSKGRLQHTWREGRARFNAYLDDYAALANGLVSLYEATFDERWIDEAVTLADVMLAEFMDAEQGGFFYTATDHEQLISRQKDIQDSSVPSATSLAATALVRLAKLTGRADLADASHRAIVSCAAFIEKAPSATGQMVIALDMHLGPTQELVFVGAGDGAETRQVLADLWSRFWPNKVVAARPSRGRTSPALAPLFEGKPIAAQDSTLYICQDFACREPAVGRETILAAFDTLAPREIPT